MSSSSVCSINVRYYGSLEKIPVPCTKEASAGSKHDNSFTFKTDDRAITGLALKKLIGEKIGVTEAHIGELHVSAKGESCTIWETDSVFKKLEQVPYMGFYNGPSHISFSIIKCSDNTHCPKMLYVQLLGFREAKIEVPYDSQMTLDQLKGRISTSVDSAQIRVIKDCRILYDGEKTLESYDIGAESGIFAIRILRGGTKAASETDEGKKPVQEPTVIVQ
jgi:hypothetical protein